VGNRKWFLSFALPLPHLSILHPVILR
jgi:hypothetical protein